MDREEKNCEDTGEEIKGAEKMVKEQILKKHKMMVNQAEEKLILHFFFILILQFTAIRW